MSAIAADLLAAPKPAICLDTCDILEVVQCLDWEGKERNVVRPVTCIDSVRRLVNTLTVDPNRAKVIITDLVHREWNQNIAEIQQKASDFLAKVDAIVGKPYQAAGLAGTALPVYPSLAASTLVADLVALSSALLNQALRLDLEAALIQRALDRVMNKQRPSHDGHIKDSINFEHYLEFARNLRANGFADDVIFVSKNRKDYWSGNTGRIHPALEPEISDRTVHIRFFGNLHAALGFLHIQRTCDRFVEFEDANEKSIFNKTSKLVPEWSRRFEHGFSELVDWILWIENSKETAGFVNR
jgi:PIN domain